MNKLVAGIQTVLVTGAAGVVRKSNCPKVKINIERTDETLYAEIDSKPFYTDTTWQPKYDMEAMVQSVFEHLNRPSHLP